MIKQQDRQSFLFAVVLIVMAAITRFIPGDIRPENFTAIGAMALFSGAIFQNKKASFLLPFCAMFLTDLLIGFHFSLLPVYGCFAFTVWMGILISRRLSFRNILIMSLLSSTVFFLVTNLPFWYSDIRLYPMTLAGTMESYVNALPFYRNQVAGDLFYSLILFGLYFFVNRPERKLKEVRQHKGRR